jgi:hypothetical protein
MSKKLGILLVAYSILLAGLSGLAYWLAPAIAMSITGTGIAGGVLCFIWGLRAIWGNRSKAWAILTLVPINFMVGSHAILFWAGGGEAVSGRQAMAIVATALFLLSIATLATIAYAGVLFDRDQGTPAMQPARR